MKIAKNLALPVDAVTQTFGFVGRKGSGKSNAAAVLVESMLDARAQVVALDPVGVWWGLRLAGDGQGAGYSIPILGGQRADVPIDPAAGRLIADLVVSKRISAVVDVSSFRKAERKRFVTDFAEELFHRKKTERGPLHVVLEEAQAFVPQRAAKGEERMLGAFEDIVRIGRNYGIGCSLISQRPQSVNKEVLSQVEALVVLQLVGAHERKAIEQWIVAQGADLKEALRELPGLQTGEAYFWSPGWLRTFQRVAFPLKWSYDASATPRVGEERVDPRILEADEIDDLRDAMAEVVERTEAEDPKALRRRIAELERELRQARSAAPEPDPEALERARRQGAEAATGQLHAFAGQVDRRSGAVGDVLEDAASLLSRASAAVEKAQVELRAPIDLELPERRQGAGARRGASRLSRAGGGTAQGSQPSRAVPRAGKPEVPGRLAAPSAEGITGPMQKILDAIAWLVWAGVERPTKVQIAARAGYAVGGGGFRNPLGTLNTSGLVQYQPGDVVVLTAEGAAIAREPETAPSTEALHESVLATLPGNTHRRILRAVLDVYPAEISTQDLAASLEPPMEPGGGGFRNPLGRLRTLGLVEYPERGLVRASDSLFL